MAKKQSRDGKGNELFSRIKQSLEEAQAEIRARYQSELEKLEEQDIPPASKAAVAVTLIEAEKKELTSYSKALADLNKKK